MRQATVEKRSEEDLKVEETVDGSMLSAELMGATSALSYTHAVHLGGPIFSLLECGQSQRSGN
jgi:hypothetical protein